MPIPNAPTSMDEFNQKAKDFVAKAKQAGKSNTAIANTLKLMYGLTIQQMESSPEEGSEWDIVKDVDGNNIWVNKKTQESKPFDSTGGFDFSAIESDESTPNLDQTDQNIPNLTLNDSGGLDELFTSEPTANQQVLDQLDVIDNPEKKGSKDVNLSSYGVLPLTPFQDQPTDGLSLPQENPININLKKAFPYGF
jgi:hypothetical protein